MSSMSPEMLTYLTHLVEEARAAETMRYTPEDMTYENVDGLLRHIEELDNRLEAVKNIIHKYRSAAFGIGFRAEIEEAIKGDGNG